MKIEGFDKNNYRGHYDSTDILSSGDVALFITKDDSQDLFIGYFLRDMDGKEIIVDIEEDSFYQDTQNYEVVDIFFNTKFVIQNDD